MRGRIKHRGVGNVTIGLVVLNAPVLAVEEEGANVLSVMQLGCVALRVPVLVV